MPAAGGQRFLETRFLLDGGSDKQSLPQEVSLDGRADPGRWGGQGGW